MPRRKRLLTALAIALPFVLPVLALGTWLVRETMGQPAESGNIIASIDASGSGTTYLSTVLPDGSSAQWTCSAGFFMETDEPEALGRSVTWKPEPGFSDSVTIVVTTPTAVDSVRFLPFIPHLTPSITVSSAYHLAITDRSRRISLSPGRYLAIVENDNLTGYDGIIVLLFSEPGSGRSASAAQPGDTLPLEFPLGAEVDAFCVDRTEDALDNGGSILVTFEGDST
jgi:hypothetical protein